jgi:hypothetical protein
VAPNPAAVLHRPGAQHRAAGPHPGEDRHRPVALRRAVDPRRAAGLHPAVDPRQAVVPHQTADLRPVAALARQSRCFRSTPAGFRHFRPGPGRRPAALPLQARARTAPRRRAHQAANSVAARQICPFPIAPLERVRGQRCQTDPGRSKSIRSLARRLRESTGIRIRACPGRRPGVSRDHFGRPAPVRS